MRQYSDWQVVYVNGWWFGNRGQFRRHIANVTKKKPTYNEFFQNQHSTVIIKNDLLRLAMASFYPLRKREGDIMPNLFVDNYVSRSEQRELSELLFYYWYCGVWFRLDFLERKEQNSVCRRKQIEGFRIKENEKVWNLFKLFKCPSRYPATIFKLKIVTLIGTASF